MAVDATIDTATGVEGSTPAAAAVDATVDTGTPAACALASQLSRCNPLQPLLRIEVMFDAEVLGPDAELHAIDGEWLLVHGTDRGDLLVRVPTQVESAPRIYTLPADYEAIDVSARWDKVFVLACRAQRCELFQAAQQTPEGELVAISGSALDESFAARGLVNRLATVGTDLVPEPCVFGDGLHCFVGGSWRTEIASTPDTELIDVALGNPSVALTRAGLLLIRLADDAEWMSSSSFEGHVLRSEGVSSDGAGVLIDGSRSLQISSDGARAVCELGQAFAALRAASEDSRRQFAVTDSNELINYASSGSARGETFCGRQALPAEPVIDLGMARCGIIDNPRVLTRTALLGSRFCAVD